ncbi:uncharacterized protein LOC106090979 isoform X1 [Stomoxys calcitrans]|uniref:uncharacterized protein LOC106090979 isoform X1 n=1 Tax=Stomoxys calcitrans TaxID=35570 RepID=UPI0027E2523E|nr:uncharacterized protein LOC106090979 isoform X1 [Stomoxys calcitrans]
MPTARLCIVRGCKNEEGLSLFSFTYENMDAWLHQLGMEGRQLKMSYEKVCQRHFTEDSFVGYNKTKLKPDAVPTLYLGLDEYGEEEEEEEHREVVEIKKPVKPIHSNSSRLCIVRGCKKEEGYSLFSFTYENMDAWLHQLGMEGRQIRMSYEKVCQRHFDENSFANYNRTKLKPDAVPTLFLGLDEYGVEMEMKRPAAPFEFHPSISEEERRFYVKAYPTVDVVRERKVHCTVCKTHIGTAAVNDVGIKMHPILRVSHCLKCHDFYNSGEFSKGEDGSELYCRWCGQGGEVYCCSSCPYVFCKSCIVKNLSRGVVADIEQNENWNCFSCAPKILWPLRAQHWALMNYIDQQKKEAYAMNLNETELQQLLRKDRSKCCRLSKTKCGNMSDSLESLDSVLSKRSHGSTGSAKKTQKHATPSPQPPNAKRAKTNDEVVCTPDLLSMLEPDCQITVAQKNNQQRPMQSPSTSTPRVVTIQPQGGFSGSGGVNVTSTPKSSVPPPLILRNTGIKLRPAAQPPIVRRTVIGPRAPVPGGNGTPVYHTINGFRIDLNTAAQQETFRLPNGKLIQVKRQGPPPGQGASPNQQVHLNQSPGSWPQLSAQHQTQQQQQQRVVPQTIASRPVQITQHPYPGPNIPGQPPVVRYHNNMIGTTTINAIGHNGGPLQAINGQIAAPTPVNIQQNVPPLVPGAPIRPVMVRHIFPETPIGQARTQLQEQVFNAMEICTHLTNKVQTLTNSNAYKQAKNYLEVKELYIHLSYLLTYAIGRFKGLQDKCLADMRHLGFGNDADCLENGQLAADKQASDDEDNEIEIVEPKTDLINLDSDDDDPPPPPPPPIVKKTLPSTPTTIAQARVVISPEIINIQKPPSAAPNNVIAVGTYVPPALAPLQAKPSTPAAIVPTPCEEEENLDLMSMAQSFLASMLEVDINEGSHSSPSGSDSPQVKKQPRKKTTHKPNPTLLKQKAMMERERLEEMKRNDHKLKMKCAVKLTKAEEQYPIAKQMLRAKLQEKQKQKHDEEDETLKRQKEMASTTMMVNTGQETIEVQLVIEDDVLNSSTEEAKETEERSKGEKEDEIINISHDESVEQKESPKEISLIEEEQKKQSPSKTVDKDDEEKGNDKEVSAEKNILTDEEEEEESITKIIITEEEVNDESASKTDERGEQEMIEKSKTDNEDDDDLDNSNEEASSHEEVKHTSEILELLDEVLNGKDEDKGSKQREIIENKPTSITTADSQASQMDVDADMAEDEIGHKETNEEDIEDAEVYKEIERVLQRQSSKATEEEEDLTMAEEKATEVENLNSTEKENPIVAEDQNEFKETRKDSKGEENKEEEAKENEGKEEEAKEEAAKEEEAKEEEAKEEEEVIEENEMEEEKEDMNVIEEILKNETTTEPMDVDITPEENSKAENNVPTATEVEMKEPVPIISSDMNETESNIAKLSIPEINSTELIATAICTGDDLSTKEKNTTHAGDSSVTADKIASNGNV